MSSKLEFLHQTYEDDINAIFNHNEPKPKGPWKAVIRTSDRIAFKRCRRRWGWSSHLKHNLGPKTNASPLWFGSGIHFALEDFHGWNKFGDPAKAFKAYVAARLDYDPKSTPEDYKELMQLGIDMMNYYVIWLNQRRLPYETYWKDGQPQVEVNFRFPLPVTQEQLKAWTVDPERPLVGVEYSGTIDRVVIDENGLLWLVDFKTAAAISTLHFSNDPQITNYMWAAPHIYDLPIGGFIYQQHRKKIPLPGRVLKNGSVSVAANQDTTHFMYKQTLIDIYSDVEKAPHQNIEYLNDLTRQEDEWMDNAIRIDRIQRNQHTAETEGMRIMMEIEDMLNPNLPLYPNHTRDCATFGACPFLSACTSMEDGSDWQHELAMNMQVRDSVYDSWRSKVKWPEDTKEAESNDQIDWHSIGKED